MQELVFRLQGLRSALEARAAAQRAAQQQLESQVRASTVLPMLSLECAQWVLTALLHSFLKRFKHHLCLYCPGIMMLHGPAVRGELFSLLERCC